MVGKDALLITLAGLGAGTVIGNSASPSHYRFGREIYSIA